MWSEYKIIVMQKSTDDRLSLPKRTTGKSQEAIFTWSVQHTTLELLIYPDGYSELIVSTDGSSDYVNVILKNQRREVFKWNEFNFKLLEIFCDSK